MPPPKPTSKHSAEPRRDRRRTVARSPPGTEGGWTWRERERLLEAILRVKPARRKLLRAAALTGDRKRMARALGTFLRACRLSGILWAHRLAFETAGAWAREHDLYRTARNERAQRFREALAKGEVSPAEAAEAHRAWAELLPRPAFAVPRSGLAHELALPPPPAWDPGRMTEREFDATVRAYKTTVRDAAERGGRAPMKAIERRGGGKLNPYVLLAEHLALGLSAPSLGRDHGASKQAVHEALTTLARDIGLDLRASS